MPSGSYHWYTYLKGPEVFSFPVVNSSLLIDTHLSHENTQGFLFKEQAKMKDWRLKKNRSTDFFIPYLSECVWFLDHIKRKLLIKCWKIKQHNIWLKTYQRSTSVFTLISTEFSWSVFANILQNILNCSDFCYLPLWQLWKELILLSSLLLWYNFLNFFDTELLAGWIVESTNYKPPFVKYNVWVLKKVYVLYHIPRSGWLQKCKINSDTVIFLCIQSLEMSVW